MIETALVIGLNAAVLGFLGVVTTLVVKMNREIGENHQDIKYIKQKIDNIEQEEECHR